MAPGGDVPLVRAADELRRVRRQLQWLAFQRLVGRWSSAEDALYDALARREVQLLRGSDDRRCTSPLALVHVVISLVQEGREVVAAGEPVSEAGGDGDGWAVVAATGPGREGGVETFDCGVYVGRDEEDGEPVAKEAADGVRVAEGGSQHGADLDEHAVAGAATSTGATA